MAQEGFTLLELLTVMTVMALVLVVGAPQLGSLLPHINFERSARELTASLREARSRAIVSDETVSFNLDVGRRAYWIVGSRPKIKSVSPTATVLVFSAEENLTRQKVASILFFPDGSSTGGFIKLTQNGEAYKISINWLTGEVSLDRHS